VDIIAFIKISQRKRVNDIHNIGVNIGVEIWKIYKVAHIKLQRANTRFQNFST